MVKITATINCKFAAWWFNVTNMFSNHEILNLDLHLVNILQVIQKVHIVLLLVAQLCIALGCGWHHIFQTDVMYYNVTNLTTFIKINS